MARKPMMNSASSIPAGYPDDIRPWLTGCSDERMRSVLGSNLRNVYETMTDSDQPSDLLRLAAMIDAQRAESNS